MMRPNALHRLQEALRPGAVYRRQDLARLSSSVDRHLALLVQQGRLTRLDHGLYSCPKKTVFGEAPPDEHQLLRAFLKDDRFVAFSPDLFNGLGLGMTQLYNQRLVFNRKRHGEYVVGGRKFLFLRWREAPKKLSAEFLVVELLNRLNELAEDPDDLLARLKTKVREFDTRRLRYAARHYGTYSAQLKMDELLASEATADAR